MVQPDGRVVTVEVAADGDGLVSHAGTALIAGLADRLGVADEFSAALAGARQRAGGHDPGRVLVDLAVMVADGGTSLSEISRCCATNPDLFGRGGVGPDGVAGARPVESTTNDAGPRSTPARTRRRGPWRGWPGPGRHATSSCWTSMPSLVTSHSDKDKAAPRTTSTASASTHCCPSRRWLRRPRWPASCAPGNAGSNTAADHVRAPRYPPWPIAGEDQGGRPDRRTNGCWPGPIRPAPPTASSTRYAARGRLEFSIGFPSTGNGAPSRCWRCQKGMGSGDPPGRRGSRWRVGPSPGVWISRPGPRARAIVRRERPSRRATHLYRYRRAPLPCVRPTGRR